MISQDIFAITINKTDFSYNISTTYIIFWHNLNQDEELALKIDRTVKQVRPDDWRGIQARENVIKRALFEILLDKVEVEDIFKIIYQQLEY